MSRSVLLVGNMLSKHRGTINPTERLPGLLQSEGIPVVGCSHRKNKVVRMIDMLAHAATARYDIAVVDTFSTANFRIPEVLAPVIRGRDKTLVLDLRGGGLPELARAQPHRVRRLLSQADRLISSSTYLQEFFTEFGFAVNIMPNFLQIDQFPFRPIYTDTHSILWVRAFSEVYNPHVALKCLCLLLDRYPEATLTMVGPDGGSLQSSQQTIRKLGIEQHVTILGSIPNDRLKAQYYSHSVFLNTPSHESFGMAVLEAASCGIPIVSTAVGEIPRMWVRDREVLLADEISPPALAKKIDELWRSPEVAKRLTLAAREKAETFSWDTVKQAWLEMFHGLATNPGNPGA